MCVGAEVFALCGTCAEEIFGTKGEVEMAELEGGTEVEGGGAVMKDSAEVAGGLQVQVAPELQVVAEGIRAMHVEEEDRTTEGQTTVIIGA